MYDEIMSLVALLAFGIEPRVPSACGMQLALLKEYHSTAGR